MKDNKVVISTSQYKDLKGRTGVIKKYKLVKGIKEYYVDDILYPSEYMLIQFDMHIPHWFKETELEFVNKDDERNYKLRILLDEEYYNKIS